MTNQDLDILIVDDSRDAADSLTTLMTLMGHRAKAAYSGKEAIEVVERSLPLCVMLDVHMPDMDGLELVRALRVKCGENLVLIAVTGSDADDELAADVFALVDYHFLKPVSPEALAKVLQA
ncbi:MAG: response regulator [Hydrogenophaga sp.]|uniref:response regulator n=1 Tax=Hydrogenophaga sp. TaxID=1904254 RepID=UPI00260AEA94|nr:response regulator [Hydrogenophaga sp.]MCW5670899.1 response regulator [Hydrogenophaga sp.]